MQLSSCKIKVIEDNAFKGQEKVLKNLNLQDNLLDDVPIRALKLLTILNLLDLSRNRINRVPGDAFSGLNKLTTLKLSDNNITLAPNSFRGLEGNLKNLNLKGTRLKRVPDAVRGLRSLAFLDLSQNSIKDLPGPGGVRTFDGLERLTALNLERNLIQNLGENAFSGVRKTLSSLSLLNNLLSEFPVGAIHSLKDLRVLDIGFNLLTALPETAFRGNPGITLLALDGNPLPTVPEKAFAHLNKTLRGLSLGGRFLHCDCKLKWVAEWIRNGDLQVTSRERNPQFCGTPTRFRERGFYSIAPEELICPESEIDINGPVGVPDSLLPRTASTPVQTSASSSSTTKVSFSPTTVFTQNTAIVTLPSSSSSPTTLRPSGSSSSGGRPSSSTNFETSTSVSSSKSSSSSTSTNLVITTTTVKPVQKQTNHTWKTHTKGSNQRPPLVLGFPSQRGTPLDDSKEVEVKSAFR